eukprot:gb/GECH01012731.1/.p1 GENE.gb/GECH01012731.1/~~gb/GECH01012731.1/.p1  ORF type:complete len:588 (+),score=147.24 gb/GECH01012731.1/:1-1764(+)
MKVIDEIKQKMEKNETFFSFEYFPPRTKSGLYNLYERFERMAKVGPLFIDVTWRARTMDWSMQIAADSQNLCGLNTMLHLTCQNLTANELIDVLKKVKEQGVQNILALRGDPPSGSDVFEPVEGGFRYGSELVAMIRREFGDYFGICVAGYPEGHIESNSYEEDLQNLKKKVDAGADFIITQFLYDVEKFFQFYKDCRAIGIDCPIVPGVLPIQTYRSFTRMTELGGCVSIPEQLSRDLEPIKNDDEAVREYGVKHGIELCRQLLDFGAPGIHFYTVNLEKTCLKIVKALSIDKPPRRELPFHQSANKKRDKEDVRPIFWAHRPKSYIDRTSEWDEFPNGRWGDSKSPAFGELNDNHLFFWHVGKKVDRKALWGQSIESYDDVAKPFCDYLNGEINMLPWNDKGLEDESALVKENLLRINRQGFLTINSQPAVNCAPSTHSIHGWGAPNGFVFQKAYLEFFTSPDHAKNLREELDKHPTLTYHMVNIEGEMISKDNAHQVNAVTWGIFPGREVIQPTVVDLESFSVWKDEAFALWKTQWASIYEEGSKSREIIESIHNNWWLVNIVDNDFVNGDIFAIFDKIIGVSD